MDEAKKQSCAAAIYKAPSERELAPKVTEGEGGTRASVITTLAAARSPHGSGTLSSIHSRSAASLPEVRGCPLRQDKPDTSPEVRGDSLRQDKPDTSLPEGGFEGR
ncbi:MAG: hypothetical protein IJV74_06525 [Clostridia bacterium]|nr:hypothetical protein [Clostridia bacterium]